MIVNQIRFFFVILITLFAMSCTTKYVHGMRPAEDKKGFLLEECGTGWMLYMPLKSCTTVYCVPKASGDLVCK